MCSSDLGPPAGPRAARPVGDEAEHQPGRLNSAPPLPPSSVRRRRRRRRPLLVFPVDHKRGVVDTIDNGLNRFLQIFNRPRLSRDDFFPVPLIHINGMDIASFAISTSFFAISGLAIDVPSK